MKLIISKMVKIQRSPSTFVYILFGIAIGFSLSFFIEPVTIYWRYSQAYVSPAYVTVTPADHGDPHSQLEVDDAHGPKEAMHFHDNQTDPHKGLRTFNVFFF